MTQADIDVQLIAVHWRWLHAVWISDEAAITTAEAEQDTLLEARWALTTEPGSTPCHAG